MTEATREMLARFKQHEINMVGVVLNKVRLDDSVVFQQFQRATIAALEGATARRNALRSHPAAGWILTRNPNRPHRAM